MSITRRFKPHLAKLARIRAGVGRPQDGLLLIDRNERVEPFPAAVMAALAERLGRVPVNLYPEMAPFYHRLAAWLGIGADQVFVTEGVSGAIKAVVETLAVPGDNVVFPTPSFALYPVYAAMYQTEARAIGYRGWRLDLDALLAAIDDRTAAVFLPNPNVPIESPFDLDAVERIAARCAAHGALLAVDEVYFPFGGPTALPLVGRCDNLVVMRSFSKAFGLAGIRVGAMIGPAPLIEYLSKTRSGYETNALSAEAALFFMENDHLVREYVAAVKDGLALVKGELSGLGLAYSGGDTSNFLYVAMDGADSARGLAARLKARGIYIRQGWPAPFDAGFSITGAPRLRMETFVAALRECLA